MERAIVAVVISCRMEHSMALDPSWVTESKVNGSISPVALILVKLEVVQLMLVVLLALFVQLQESFSLRSSSRSTTTENLALTIDVCHLECTPHDKTSGLDFSNLSTASSMLSLREKFTIGLSMLLQSQLCSSSLMKL